MIKRINVFNTPSSFSFKETIIQNSGIISNPIPRHSSFSANTAQPSKINWWWWIGGLIIALGAFAAYYFWKKDKKEKELVVTAEKEKNAQTKDTLERLNSVVNKEPVIESYVKNQLSQNNGYPSSDNNQDDVLSRLFKK